MTKEEFIEIMRELIQNEVRAVVAEELAKTKKTKTKKSNVILEAPMGKIMDQVKEVIEHLNEKAGTGFKFNALGNSKYVVARLNEGYTVEEIKKVVDMKCDEWIDDPKMSTYLRPSTLFSSENFSKYHGIANKTVHMNFNFKDYD